MAEEALRGVRIIELADRLGEFCGRLLAGLGADVIKVEPPGGAPSRRIGPFYEGRPGPERSLHFWQYNLGKRAVTLDPTNAQERDLLRRLVRSADVVLESYPPGHLDRLGAGYRDIADARVVWVSMSDFGQDGPYRDWQGSDLVHLALGGQMAVCGYPAGEDGYDTPPIAPQMNHAEHIASLQACTDILAALFERSLSGRGQYIDFSVHSAVNACTEFHLSTYLVGQKVASRGGTNSLTGAVDRDGVPVVTQPALFPGEWERIAEMLAEDEDLRYVLEPEFADPVQRMSPAVQDRLLEAQRTWVSRRSAEEIFHMAQRRGVAWAPVRKPHASLTDEHFRMRGNFTEVAHPELGRSFTYGTTPWVSPEMPWRAGPRAPLLGEHNAEVFGALSPGPREAAAPGPEAAP
jgi:crotonobetainyl-CoA:carnitine CoA-transferase CaiB-like acyl-CoA transferase